MDKLSMVYSHEEILYNKVNEHTSAHKHNLWKKPMKRGQILPLVLHNVSWVTFKVYRPPLNDWKGNIFCACILPISFYVTLRKRLDMYFLAPVSGPGHLLIESVECRNTDHLSLPFSQTSALGLQEETIVSVSHAWKCQILKWWFVNIKCWLTWDYCTFGKSPTYPLVSCFAF